MFLFCWRCSLYIDQNLPVSKFGLIKYTKITNTILGRWWNELKDILLTDVIRYYIALWPHDEYTHMVDNHIAYV